MAKTDSDLLSKRKKRFSAMSDAESEGRVERLDDKKFVRLGEQWPENVKRDRETPGAERPCLVINRLFQFRQQVINEIRQNRPSIKCRPVSDGADVDTAEILQGLIRHIEQASDADAAYDTAAENQVDTGLGYFRVITQYSGQNSFDQDIFIKRVPDEFKVYFDELSTEPDGSDARDAFVVEEWDREIFEATHKDVDTSSWGEAGGGDGWITKDTVRIAEYFYIDKIAAILVLLADGSIGFEDELSEEQKPLVIKKRPSEKRICKWEKWAGDQLIDETELPCSYVPIFPVYGSETFVEGKRHLHGLIRFAKDAQRLYNYSQSANTETVALAPKAPFIAAEGQLEDHETEWANANRINLSVLEYKPVTEQTTATVLPAPRREMPPQANPAFEAAMNRSIDDMKATMGIYDASLGNRESDQSGKAIMSQQRQASLGNFHFSDNLSRSIKHAGRVILEMIPKVYDTARIIRIIGEDGSAKHIQLDPNQQQAVTEQKDPQTGKVSKIYNLGVGKYDVTIDVGPSYATKRQEAADSMMQMVQALPALGQVAGDLIVQNLDWPGAQEISKRMKAMLPPQIQQELQSEEQGDIPPQISQMMHQMADQMQHMSQMIQQLQEAPELKKLEIDEYNAHTQRIKAESEILNGKMSMIHKMAEADLAHQIAEGQREEQQEEMQENQSPVTAQTTTPGGAQNE